MKGQRKPSLFESRINLHILIVLNRLIADTGNHESNHAGFLGKFLLLKSVIDGAATGLPYVTLITVAIIGVIVSLYYYFGIIREIYWSTGLRPDDTPEDKPPFEVPLAIKASLVACAMALVFIGIYPEPVLALTYEALEVFR